MQSRLTVSRAGTGVNDPSTPLPVLEAHPCTSKHDRNVRAFNPSDCGRRLAHAVAVMATRRLDDDSVVYAKLDVVPAVNQGRVLGTLYGDTTHSPWTPHSSASRSAWDVSVRAAVGDGRP